MSPLPCKERAPRAWEKNLWCSSSPKPQFCVIVVSEALIYDLPSLAPQIQTIHPRIFNNNPTNRSYLTTESQIWPDAGDFLLEERTILVLRISCVKRFDPLDPSLCYDDCFWETKDEVIDEDKSNRPPPWPRFSRTEIKLGLRCANMVGCSYISIDVIGRGLCGLTIILVADCVWYWLCEFFNPSSPSSLPNFPYKYWWGVVGILHNFFSYRSSLFKHSEAKFTDKNFFLLVIAPTEVDKGKQPMVAEDPAPKMRKTPKCKGKPKGVKLAEENPISNDGGKAEQSAKTERKTRKRSMNREKLMALQGKVQENISMLHQSSIFATIIWEPMEAKIVRKKMRYAWKNLSGGFQLIPIANNWFELRFDLIEDRSWVWDNRHFHVSGQLIVLRPWRLDFDPWNESLTMLDLWIRFPGLPAKYVHEEILKDIIKANKLGNVIKVSAFNAKGARFRYPRVCVSVDLTKISGREVLVANENGEEESYPIWFEDFPLGCGSCGAADHGFDDCPGRIVCNNGATGGVQPPVMEPQQSEDAVHEQGDGEWVKAAAKKPLARPPPMLGHSKEELLKSFGKNTTISSDSSSSKSPGRSVSNSSAVHVVSVSMDPGSVIDAVPLSAVMSDMPPLMVIPPHDEKTNFLKELQPGLPSSAADDDDYEMFHEEEFLDECLVSEGLVDPGLTQADYEVIFRDVPPSVEFKLPDLSDPERLAESLHEPFFSSAMSPIIEDQASPSGASKSESGNRKMKIEKGDSACSTMTLMGGSTKKGKHV